MARHAAIDVGSNSIRLLIAEVDGCGRRTTVHEDREVVRLGTGVFRDGRLEPSATEAALAALERMSFAVRSRRVSSARAVGTSALRDAANQSTFVRHATALLGLPLEVIDGVEEARLVHLGVRDAVPHPDERLVIVDLGGGSAQLILSDHGLPLDAVSLPVGAVRLTEQFGCADRPPESVLADVQRHVRDHLDRVAHWLPGEIDRVIATSGTARTIVSVVHALERTDRRRADGLTASTREMAGVLEALAGSSVEERQCVTGVGRRRAAVLPAGLAVLHEIVTGLGVRTFQYSAAGLVDGIVSDLARGSHTGHAHADTWAALPR